MEPVTTEVYAGMTINYYQDTDVRDPRAEFDHLGHMVCWHRRYTLGDAHDFSPEEFGEFVKRERPLLLPIYAYEHGQITLSTVGSGYPFNDVWDSGVLGFIYVTREEVQHEYGCQRIGPRIRERALTLLRMEVKEYDQFLTGEVYGYDIEDSSGNDVDSCWGFYGFEYCREQARAAAEYEAAHKEKEAA